MGKTNYKESLYFILIFLVVWFGGPYLFIGVSDYIKTISEKNRSCRKFSEDDAKLIKECKRNEDLRQRLENQYYAKKHNERLKELNSEMEKFIGLNEGAIAIVENDYINVSFEELDMEKFDSLTFLGDQNKVNPYLDKKFRIEGLLVVDDADMDGYSACPLFMLMSQKKNVSGGIYLDIGKLTTVQKKFINSSCSYCPVTLFGTIGEIVDFCSASNSYNDFGLIVDKAVFKRYK